jgi:hypothetical protein
LNKLDDLISVLKGGRDAAAASRQSSTRIIRDDDGKGIVASCDISNRRRCAQR